MTTEQWPPEWCIVGNLRPYANPRKLFPTGAKLYLLGGFAGMGYETITVVGYARGRSNPVIAHIMRKHVENWRVQLVYRPAVLRAIHKAMAEEPTCHRWLDTGHWPTFTDYGDHLKRIVASFEI